MPKQKTLTSPADPPAGTSVDDLCQQFLSQQTELESATTNADKRRLKRFHAELRDELVRRLGDRTDNVLEWHSAGYSYEEYSKLTRSRCKKFRSRQSAQPVADSPPQRLRRPRVMYVEQKTDGNQDLHDRGPAAIGEVSFSKSGRTACFNGKALRRVKGHCVNFQCVADGNFYWISGVKKRDGNCHWAGDGPVAVLVKPDR